MTCGAHDVRSCLRLCFQHKCVLLWVGGGGDSRGGTGAQDGSSGGFMDPIPEHDLGLALAVLFRGAGQYPLMRVFSPPNSQV